MTARPVLPPAAAAAIVALENAGYEAYAVGGFVRDSLRGALPGDVDIASSAPPEAVAALFSACRVVPTGIKHGTVTVVLGGEPLEITTFRAESAYSDLRHPDRVAFTGDILRDLARRDFTVNAMAWSPSRGLIDPFGGESDIRRRVIRAVGDPAARFGEDALRVLRALRFASALGFSVAPDTAAALIPSAALLTAVSAERKRDELQKLLCGAAVRPVLAEYAGPLSAVLPELAPMRGFDQKNPWHIYDLLEHTARTVENVPPVPALRWAALLHDAGKPACFTLDGDGVGHFYGHPAVSAAMADAALRRLRFDNRTRELVVSLVAAHDLRPPATVEAVRRAMARLGPDTFFMLTDLMRADSLAQNPAMAEPPAHFAALRRIAEGILAEGGCISLRTLAVNGDDILALGAAPGHAVGELLEALLTAVIDGALPNDRAALVSAASEHIRQAR